ncbi:MAG: hypothetical protein Q9165_002010 [Trypethelium subeluteriae]
MDHPGNAISPAAHSEGRGGSQISSDRSQVPPGLISSGTSDLTENTFNTADYANLATGQEFGPMSQAGYSEQPFSRFPSQFNNVAVAQTSYLPSYPTFNRQFSDPTNQTTFTRTFVPHESQIRSGSVASFVDSDFPSAVPGQALSRPPLIRQSSSQTFSIRSTNASEGPTAFDSNMENPQVAQFMKPSTPDVNAPLQTSSELSQDSHYDGIVEESHGYLQYPIPGSFEVPFIRREPSSVGNVLPFDQTDDDTYLPSNTTAVRQSSEERGEAEARQARSHHLYAANPHPDDLYHCPYEASENCPHKPTKLKCVYDKYIDSHLRPFRCKAQACATLQFSSTACLLRHEREAHGMHGHGAKPHLCSYKDCERSIPGNGFPRRYNLFDHMKRVHDYKVPASPPHSTTDNTPRSAGPKRQTSRKRKPTGPGSDESHVSEKRNKVEVSRKAEDPPRPVNEVVQKNRRLSEMNSLEALWKDRYTELCQHVQLLESPQDLLNLQKVSNDIGNLHEIARQWRGYG